MRKKIFCIFFAIFVFWGVRSVQAIPISPQVAFQLANYYFKGKAAKNIASMGQDKFWEMTSDFWIENFDFDGKVITPKDKIKQSLPGFLSDSLGFDDVLVNIAKNKKLYIHYSSIPLEKITGSGAGGFDSFTSEVILIPSSSPVNYGTEPSYQIVDNKMYMSNFRLDYIYYRDPKTGDWIGSVENVTDVWFSGYKRTGWDVLYIPFTNMTTNLPCTEIKNTDTEKPVPQPLPTTYDYSTNVDTTIIEGDTIFIVGDDGKVEKKVKDKDKDSKKDGWGVLDFLGELLKFLGKILDFFVNLGSNVLKFIIDILTPKMSLSDISKSLETKIFLPDLEFKTTFDKKPFVSEINFAHLGFKIPLKFENDLFIRIRSIANGFVLLVFSLFTFREISNLWGGGD